MIDGYFGARLAKVWEYLARGLARAGCSPNAVTYAGLVLVIAGAAAYPAHGNSLAFAVWLAFAFAFDGLDGAVARLTGRATKFGGYLDAVADRYQELVVLASIAWVHDLWPAAFAAVTGGYLTSYNKARVALEIPTDNAAWPDLFERLERLLFVIALLALDGILGAGSGTGSSVLSVGLVALAVLTHATALQRFARARRRIIGVEAAG